MENDPDDESRLNLTINRKPIADWFREQWHRLRYGARVPQQEERKRTVTARQNHRQGFQVVSDVQGNAAHGKVLCHAGIL